MTEVLEDAQYDELEAESVEVVLDDEYPILSVERVAAETQESDVVELQYTVGEERGQPTKTCSFRRSIRSSDCRFAVSNSGYGTDVCHPIRSVALSRTVGQRLILRVSTVPVSGVSGKSEWIRVERRQLATPVR
ncbi:hypothetical protein C482_02706 [Natrialba chahannaoensis JCM 10990]|uniref:Uncharacterized protein n=1 Tax=Natrialba chahannaoensis JCM 10990 TaxID=1227492 RepID=M0B5Y4_9EURY|nr:hypothetical protein C482_02706 [Natrialba chahannaoensis JCM 10990]